MSATMQLETNEGMESREHVTTADAKGVLVEKEIEQLRQSLRGSVISPVDAGYDAARKVWNGMIDRRPVLIVQCRGTADVIAAVNFAREHALPVSVRGGGHNVAGSAVVDGALLIDLSQMRSVRVDLERSSVRVEGGATLSDIDHETQAFGLAVPSGLMSRTGIAGLALHGGLGFLTRKYGATADNLVAADVVTADGKLLQVDKDHHPDLFWALRGGGSFGVVTSFEFQLHPVGPQVWIALVMYPLAEAKSLVQFFRSFMRNAPDEVMGFAIYWTAPGEEFIPEEYRGAPILALGAGWFGRFEEGERALQPLREAGTPVADLSGPMPFVAAQSLFDAEYPDGRRYYWKSIYLPDLGDALIDVLSNYAARRPTPMSTVDIWGLGGAWARVKPGESALAHRDAPFLLQIEANWDDPTADAESIAWARALYQEAQKFSPGGSYLNFPGLHEEGEKLLKQSFGANYDRLREVKAKYDPGNLFRFNLRIPAKS